MKSVIKKIAKLLPMHLRLKLYRKMVKVPNGAFDENYTIEIAKTKEDLEQSYRLLHDCYVGINIMNTHPSKLRCTYYSLLPNTVTVVAKYKNRIVGTVALIIDSKLGIPSDKEYLTENNSFRKNQRKLIEVSALAVDKNFRTSSHACSLLLMKYLLTYSKDILRADYLVCTVHPKAQDFYQAIFGFERHGKVVDLDSVKGALAVYLTMDLSPIAIDKYTKAYRSKDIMKNVLVFTASFDDRFIYPIPKLGTALNPAITADLLNHFCVQRQNIWQDLDQNERIKLVEIYSTYFGIHSLKVAVPKNSVQKDYRTEINLSAKVKTDGHQMILKIKDLTSNGCFIEWNKEVKSPQGQIELTFNFSGVNYSTQAKVAWENNNDQIPSYSYGFGIKFSKPIPQLNTKIREWLYNDSNFTLNVNDVKTA